MDFYKEYLQTSSIEEVNKLKKRGYEVINVHTQATKGNNISTFTLGLSYKIIAETLNSFMKDLETIYSKEDNEKNR